MGEGQGGTQETGRLGTLSIFMLLFISGRRLELKETTVHGQEMAGLALSHHVTLKMTFSSGPWQCLLGEHSEVLLNVLTS